ncbi:MAG: YbhB/YbcL family Raf kinase inhibitor-like protein [Ancalomicrobiaceae bacterium]|nr:YbhB/YbcL family Raf kinase inhibitor-like protein [Ancalomicrobiaceae bacterium]
MIKTGKILAIAAGFAAAVGTAEAADFHLTSSDIAEGRSLSAAQVLNGFGCTGDNRSPQLSWSGEPAGTKSFVVTAYDPDAPTGSGWWHWVAFNIPASAHDLATAASGKTMPAGSLESRTDFGGPGFGGACPPAGDKAHRYVFTVYALKVDKLEADANASAAFIGFMTHFNSLAKATLTASYGR